MKNPALLKWGLGASVIMAACGLVVASMLPANTQLPIHWDANGSINGYANKWVALQFAPLLLAFVTVILQGSTKIDPRPENIARSEPFIQMTMIGLIILMALIQTVIASYGFRTHLPALRMIMGGCAVMLLVTGNYLPKTRPNFFFGIRTPWTLSNDDIWLKTHRLGGYTFVAAGVALIGVALFGPTGAGALHIVIGVIVTAAIVPIIYSYLLWRSLPTK